MTVLNTWPHKSDSGQAINDICEWSTYSLAARPLRITSEWVVWRGVVGRCGSCYETHVQIHILPIELKLDIKRRGCIS